MTSQKRDKAGNRALIRPAHLRSSDFTDLPRAALRDPGDSSPESWVPRGHGLSDSRGLK